LRRARGFGPRFRAVRAIGSLGVLWTLGAAAADLSLLLRSAESDPAPKVRLQALRILRKRQAMDGGAVDPRLRALLRSRVESDPHPLVRGFAARGLGELGTRADRSVLVAARSDPDPRVRTLVDRALRQLDARWARSRPVLVVEAAVPPGAPTADWVRARLVQALRRGEPDAFEVAAPADAEDRTGHWVQATVVGPAADPNDPQKVEVQLRVAVGTWPAKNLRHVVTSRARAPGTASAALAKRLLRAAVRAAARDVLAELRKG
jgi:HEAT repeat protein